MNQFTEGRQTAIMLGGFICYRILSSYLKTVSPILASVVIGAWLVFVLWAHLARGFSSAFIVMDRFARQALRPREYWEVVVVGGLGSIPGAFVASMLIGIVQTFAVALDYSLLDLFRVLGVTVGPASALREVYAVKISQAAPMLPYLLLVLVLIVRPRGLLGTRDT
jgi:ABC-type branched-subunit amino acid transport system permease subunit